MKPIAIYTISNANNGQVCYVGATNQPLLARLRQHENERRLPVVSTLDANPVIEVIEIVDSIEAARDAEQFWISQMTAWGFELQNWFETRPYKQSPPHDKEPRVKINGVVRERSMKAILQRMKKCDKKHVVHYTVHAANVMMSILAITGRGPRMKPITEEKLRQIEAILKREEYL